MSAVWLPRRRLLLAGAVGSLSGLSSILAHGQAPAVVTLEKARPGFPSGVQSGDVLADRGVVWARCDCPARLWVEWSTTASFQDTKRLRGAYAMDSTDHTARLDLVGLPSGQDIFYRALWEDPSGGGLSEPMTGHFRTAPAKARDVRFVWSGDTAGQGWGISEEFGGMKIYEAMRRLNPDFFIHSGDNIYADGPILPEVKLADGSMWRNSVLTEEKSKVAETLREFRGAYRYNMLDVNMRSYRGPNSYNRQAELNAESQYLGPQQLAWLRAELKKSKAVWKVIASDMPIGLQVTDGKDAQGRVKFEAVANGDGPALGREIEIAQLPSFIKHQRIRNTVWLTADVHYTAAHHYHPNRAQFQDFDPFWEFVGGPLHAGTFGPNELDNTFGPEVRFVKAPATGQVNLPPSAGMQFFGDVQIAAKTAEMTVHLRDLVGASLWSTTLLPVRA